jgi:hypothetical protein
MDFALRDYKKQIHQPHNIHQITVEEMKEAIRTSGNSSPGPDGIPMSFYKATINLSAEILTKVARRLGNPTKPPPPPGFNFGLGFFLPKPGIPVPYAHETRPISVPDTSNRLVSRVLNSKLTPHIADILSQYQKCALPGRVIHDNIRAFLRILRGAHKETTDVYPSHRFHQGF